MTSSCESCESCRATFKDTKSNDKYGETIDRTHPSCACEAFEVSSYSPGPVEDSEKLYRMIILPGDFDHLESLTFTSVEDVYKKGLSVVRARATNEEITDLATDRLYVVKGAEPRTIHGFIEIDTVDVRAMQKTNVAERLFCVYDETVKRKFDPEAPHVPTHAGIFQTHFPAGEEDKKAKTKKECKKLFNYLRDPSRIIKVDKFRNGGFMTLNESSKDGKFTYEKQ